MKIDLTEDEMLALRRQSRGLDTCGVYGAVTDYVDWMDLDTLLRQQMQGFMLICYFEIYEYEGVI